MSSRRLLDLFALANASATIARKHFLIRSHQLGHYAATSSILKARVQPARSDVAAPPQKEGVAQDHHYEPGEATTTSRGEIPIHPTAETPVGEVKRKEGITQDRHFFPGEGTTAATTTATDAKQLQHKYERTIPPETAAPPVLPETHADVVDQEAVPAEKLSGGANSDRFYLRHAKTSDVASNLPRVKIPHKIVGEQPGGFPGVNNEEFTRMSVPSKEETTAAEDRKMEELGAQVFQSRRARGLFGVKPKLQGMNGPASKYRAAAENERAQLEQMARVERHLRAITEEAEKNAEEEKEKEIEQAVVDEARREELKVADAEIKDIAAEISHGVREYEKADPVFFCHVQQPPEPSFKMNASRVPSSRFGRLLHYGGLAAGMAWGAASESVRRVAGGAQGAATSVMFSESNIERLVKKLSRMRGAALKLGQMMSFQDNLLPAPIQEVLARVQDSADYMPASQRDQVLAANLGPSWRELFSEFSEVPMAAASIGQVHAARLASNGIPVAVKIQYPGVADSISSDLNNLSVLLTASKLLPKGLYLEKTIANARLELGWECDYVREAECAKRFAEILEGEKDVFSVPRIFESACGPQVLTMELMNGVAVTKAMKTLSQEERDFIGTQILGLCFREVARYRFMQTDPNWTNFLWNAAEKKIELLDFGASREFPEQFIRLYTAVLHAAADGDREAIRDISIQLGYLTGLESEAMTNAHVESILTLAEPFSNNAPEVYDFSNQTVTERVKSQIPLMLRERLAPPPEETYSLHRKLSGAFLMCARLGSRVKCREIFEDALFRENAAR
ncbi:ABC1 family-domain-containing protein [Sphaerosporella brunnea]|uniref:ABC1 family-domain-containing protein n=1 Tax=Sphaerosporella brunnea TaxID=1250544 RepID=A0A5J5F470_9PEZI|nr:ABC1 family-domain-containing protein [Sphaerosporella brunnea]